MGFIKRCIPGWQDAIVVSPDAGGAKRATAIADKLNMDFGLFHPSRKRGKALPSGRSMTDSIGSLRTTNGRDYKDEGAEDSREDENLELLVGSVEGKIAILVDDMIDTGETVRMASISLIENGASQVWVLVGHCAFTICSFELLSPYVLRCGQVWRWTSPCLHLCRSNVSW
jgi:ribose-phosphate pyrophosphokinase